MSQENWTPKSLLELSGSYWKTCTLHAAVALRLFTLLEGEGLPAPEVAASLGAPQRGVAPLLEALAAMGLLQRYGERYSDAPGVAALLSERSPGYIGFMILHHRQLVPSWHRLDEAVRTGAPVRTSASHDDASREAFLMGMFNNAMTGGPQIVADIDLTGRRRLLDLGGGPGTYALLFCQIYPALEAVVFDLPTSREFAEKTIRRFGLEGRVRFEPGDFLEDPLPGVFDVAWLSHILHGEGEAACRRLVAKAAAALEPGGLLLIHEFILDDDGVGPLHPALFSLNMLVGTPEGKAYREGELRAMMEVAGLKEVRRLSASGPSGSGVLAGVRP